MRSHMGTAITATPSWIIPPGDDRDNQSAMSFGPRLLNAAALNSSSNLISHDLDVNELRLTLNQITAPPPNRLSQFKNKIQFQTEEPNGQAITK